MSYMFLSEPRQMVYREVNSEHWLVYYHDNMYNYEKNLDRKRHVAWATLRKHRSHSSFYCRSSTDTQT